MNSQPASGLAAAVGTTPDVAATKPNVLPLALGPPGTGHWATCREGSAAAASRGTTQMPASVIAVAPLPSDSPVPLGNRFWNSSSAGLPPSDETVSAIHFSASAPPGVTNPGWFPSAVSSGTPLAWK